VPVLLQGKLWELISGLGLPVLMAGNHYISASLQKTSISNHLFTADAI